MPNTGFYSGYVVCLHLVFGHRIIQVANTNAIHIVKAPVPILCINFFTKKQQQVDV